jgi:hypothetical protein
MTERLLEIGSAIDNVVACKILDMQLGQVHDRGGKAEVLTFTLDDGSVLRITSAGNDGWEFWFRIDHEPG